MMWIPIALAVWVLVGGLVGWLISRWLRFLRGEFDPPTPWEPSFFDPDVEVRWAHGQVESRLKERSAARKTA